MIGVFTALLLGMLTTVSTLFVRVVRSEVGGLHGVIDGGVRGFALRPDHSRRIARSRRTSRYSQTTVTMMPNAAVQP